MQIHELNTFVGTPGDIDFLATDNGADTSKISVKNLLKAPNDEIENTKKNKVNQPLDGYNQPTNGTNGQLLRTKGNGKTEWVNVGLPTDAQTAQAVSDWLDDHPEATTTVQDGAVTIPKLSAEVLEGLSPLQVSSFSDILTNLDKADNVVIQGTTISTQEVVSNLKNAYLRFDPNHPFIWNNKDSWQTGYYNNGWIYSNKNAIVFSNFENVIIDGLHFYADIDDPDILTWSGIRLEDCKNVTFVNCNIQGFKWIGIDIASSNPNYKVKVKSSVLRRCRFNVYDGGVGTSIEGNTITDDYTSTNEYIANGGTWISDSTKDSLFYDGIMEYGRNAVIANNIIYDCGQSGIYSASCEGAIIIGNSVYDNWNCGIDLGAVVDQNEIAEALIANNFAKNNLKSQLNLVRVKNSLIQDNYAIVNKATFSYAGINMQRSSGNTIKNNKVRITSTGTNRALSLDENTSDNVITNNNLIATLPMYYTKKILSDNIISFEPDSSRTISPIVSNGKISLVAGGSQTIDFSDYVIISHGAGAFLLAVVGTNAEWRYCGIITKAGGGGGSSNVADIVKSNINVSISGTILTIANANANWPQDVVYTIIPLVNRGYFE